MVDSNAREKDLGTLRELIERVPAIVESSPTDETFLSWREACLDAVTSSLGVDHELTRDFARIPFRIQPDLLGRREQQFSNALGGATVAIPQDHFFRERVYEAQEVLLAARSLLGE